VAGVDSVFFCLASPDSLGPVCLPLKNLPILRGRGDSREEGELDRREVEPPGPPSGELL
jgi:hypothetical protein